MNAARLEFLFNGIFSSTSHTVLRGGADEPLYLPAVPPAPAQIIYREDFTASALHEVAHWCIAGTTRRRRRDYGYWYAPDGRSRRGQQDFQRVEARPQAMEWIFSMSCGAPFSLSLDNLSGDADPADRLCFAEEVVRQAEMLRAAGLPSRADRFSTAVHEAARHGVTLAGMTFDLRDIL